MNKSIITAVASLVLVGCNTSNTNSYVYIGDTAFKNAKVP
jgi:outer membrane lipoprotein SlyB